MSGTETSPRLLRLLLQLLLSARLQVPDLLFERFRLRFEGSRCLDPALVSDLDLDPESCSWNKS